MPATSILARPSDDDISVQQRRGLHAARQIILCSFNITAEAVSIACSTPGVVTVSTGIPAGTVAFNLSAVRRVAQAECSVHNAGLWSLITVCIPANVHVLFQHSFLGSNFDYVLDAAPIPEERLVNIVALVSIGGAIEIQDSNFLDVNSEISISALYIQSREAVVIRSRFLSSSTLALYWAANGGRGAGITNLRVVNCTFTDTVGFGAITVEALPIRSLPKTWLATTRIALENVTVTNGNNPNFGIGGAVGFQLEGSTNMQYQVSISNSNFSHCSATGENSLGGALGINIFNSTNTTFKLSISNSSLSHSETDFFGGALGINMGESTNTTFKLATNNCTFQSNEAFLGGAIAVNYSGSFNSSVTFITKSSVFNGNRATNRVMGRDPEHYTTWDGSGGAVIIEGLDCSHGWESFKPLSDDKAAGTTPAFCTKACNITWRATNTNFTSNKAVDTGGAVVLDGTLGLHNHIKIVGQSVLFQANIAGAKLSKQPLGETLSQFGGGLAVTIARAHNSSILLGGDSFAFRDNIGQLGGGVCIQTDSESMNNRIDVTPTRMLVEGNKASVGGGVALLSGDSSNVGVVFRAGSILLMNNTADSAGALYIDIVNSTSRVQFATTSNPAQQPVAFGGASNASSPDTDELKSAMQPPQGWHEERSRYLFVNNTAQTGTGGALVIMQAPAPQTGYSSIILDDCTFEDNMARLGGGGAIYHFGTPGASSAALAGIVGTLAGDDRTLGALQQSQQSGSTEASPSLINSIFGLRNTSLIRNVALNGGGIFLHNSTASVTDVLFKGNQGILLGGAVYSKSISWFKSCVFNGNSAVQGGAIYGTTGDAQALNNVTLQSCVVTANRAETDGGGLFLSSGQSQLLNCTIQGNSATSRGGAIFFSNICASRSTLDAVAWLADAAACAVTIDNTTSVSSNRAVAGGGMFYAYPDADSADNDTDTSMKASSTPSSSQPFTNNTTAGLVVNNMAQFGADISWAPLATMLEVLQDSTGSLQVYSSSTGTRGKIPLKVQVGNLAGVRVLVELWPALPLIPQTTGDINAVYSSGFTSSPSQTSTSTNPMASSLESPAAYLTGFVKGTDSSGVADFNNLHIIGGAPGVNLMNQTYSLKVSTPDFPHVQYKNVTVVIRGCVLGEARVQVPGAEGAPLQGATCDMCLDGTYALLGSQAAGDCSACPYGNAATCKSGIILPSPRHWQGAVGSSRIQTCPNQAACLGNRQAVQTAVETCLSPTNGTCTSSCQEYVRCTAKCTSGDSECWDKCSIVGSCLQTGGTHADSTTAAPRKAAYSDMFCSEGYQGYLCGSCQKGYGAYRMFRCGQCMTQGLVWLFYALALVIVCVVAVIISCNLINSLPDIEQQLQMEDVFKVLALHVQMLCIVSSLLVEWPPALKGVFAAVQYLLGPSGSGVISLDCLGVKTGSRGWVWLMFVFPALVVILTIPVMLTVKHVLSVVMASMNRMSSGRRGVGNNTTTYYRHKVLHTLFTMQGWEGIRLRHLVFASCMVSVFMLYTVLVTTSLSPFTCVIVQYTGHSHWAFNMNIKCWTEEHIKAGLAPGLLGILAFCIAVPAGILYTGWRYQTIQRHHHRNSLTSIMASRFLFRMYRDGRWYWELYACLHIVGMVAVSMFARAYGAYHQLLLFILLLLANSTLAHTLQPFQQQVVHSFHVSSILLMLVTCTGVLAIRDADHLFVLNQTGSTDSAILTAAPFTMFQNVVGVLVAVANVCFVVWGLVVMVAVQGHQLALKCGTLHHSMSGPRGGVTVKTLLQHLERAVCRVMACDVIDQPTTAYAADMSDTSILLHKDDLVVPPISSAIQQASTGIHSLNIQQQPFSGQQETHWHMPEPPSCSRSPAATTTSSADSAGCTGLYEM